VGGFAGVVDAGATRGAGGVVGAAWGVAEYGEAGAVKGRAV
jgi:hypothetical protein